VLLLLLWLLLQSKLWPSAKRLLNSHEQANWKKSLQLISFPCCA